MQSPTHLVIVCCHGIWTGGLANGADEAEWLIADFQVGETPTFLEHIRAGLKVLREDDNSVLMFSGGSTRPETRLSEAQSYANAAKANGYFGLLPANMATERRIHLDEQALDSYHNVLFSLVSFWRGPGHATWPQKLTIVSHAFKQSRIVQGHCAAIGFPLNRVRYIGLDPPSMAPVAASERQDETKLDALQGVRRAMDSWAADPHGTGAELADKRKKRNPWGKSQALFRSTEEQHNSGIATRAIEGGVVLDDVPQPWGQR